MRRSIGWSTVALVGLVGLTTGCNTEYTYITTEVTVIDAETVKPIAGALVSTSNGGVFFPEPEWPIPDEGTTDERGVVELRATATRSMHLWLRVDAEGYLSEHGGDEFRSINSDIRALIKEKRTDEVAHITIRCWAGPEPVLVVTVPNGYRGYVHGIEPPKDAAPVVSPHQRRFECTTDERGKFDLPAAPVLLKEHFPTLVAHEFRFADGAEILACRYKWDVPGVAARSFGSAYLISTMGVAEREAERRHPKGKLDDRAYDAWWQRVEAGPLPEAQGDPAR